MEWYRQVQFVAAVPMPEKTAEELGTTVNGMWAGPARADRAVVQAHAKGQRVLFSVPLIALVPSVYKATESRHLLDEVCCDTYGNRAVVPWYYWEPEPVYAVCIYSPAFRHYLLDHCRAGIDHEMDVVNLDEINTSIGLMNRQAGAPGFCRYCLARFRAHLEKEYAHQSNPAARLEAEPLGLDDQTLRRLLHDDEDLYRLYRQFHEREAFRVAVDFISELRDYASRVNPQFAITANLAYLGNQVITRGDLWGPRWGQHIDFVMMENTYQTEPGSPHLLLPRGKFTAWYRLGSAFSSHAPTWICPSIMVPRQLAGQKRTEYYLLMFLEAYANGGRWGYYWWPGVDAQTRLEATVPSQLREYASFITNHRQYYEQVRSRNELAVLYLDDSISQKPEAHYKFLALAQAMAEAGYQFDVVYWGCGEHGPTGAELQRIEGYRALLLPEAETLSNQEIEILTSYARRSDRKVIAYSDSPIHPREVQRQSDTALFDFWNTYGDADRNRICAPLTPYRTARVWSSDPLVNVVRYVKDDEQVLHLLNYNYDPATDQVTPSRELRIRVPWQSRDEPACTLLSLAGERRLEYVFANGDLVLEIPEFDLYGLVILCR